MARTLVPSRRSVRPLSRSLSRFSSAAAACAALAIATGAHAATYYWDADGTAAGNDLLLGTGLGGTGTWTTSASGAPLTSWYDGTTNIVWPNNIATPDLAVFGATAGTVTLGVPVTVGGLRFDVTGYTIGNGGTAANTITFAGATPAVTVVNAADSATITANLLGSAGLNVDGPGTVTFGGTNTFTGGLRLSAGTLNFSNDNQLGSTAGNVTLQGGTLNATASVTSGRSVVLGSGTNGLSANNTFTLTLSGVVSGNGGVSKTGAGSVTLGNGAADTASNTYLGTTTVTAGTLLMSKAAGTNAVGGDILVTGGTLGWARSNQVPDAANLTLTGGGLSWSNSDETLASITASGSANLNAGNASNGIVTVTGTLSTSGSAGMGLNSGSQWSGNTVSLGSTSAATLGGNNTRFTTLTAGSGGLTLAGQTVSLNTVANAGTNVGSKIIFASPTGDLTSSGTSSIGVTNAYGARDVDLGGVNRNVNVTSGALTIGAIVTNGGIVKKGSGGLTLSNLTSTANGFTGNILVEAGTLSFVGSGNADQVALGIGPKTITLTNNATLALINADADPNAAGGKGFVIGTGGGTFDVASGRTFTLNDGVANTAAQNQLQGSGTLTKTGAGALVVGRDYSATFTGDVNVNLGRVDITVPGAVGNGLLTVDATLGATRLNLTNTVAFAPTNNIVLQNGAVLSTTGANQNIASNRALSIGAGTARIRLDDGAGAGVSTTARTFVVNGAFNGGATTTVEVAGPNSTTRGILALSNTQSNFAGTYIIDKSASLENHPRFNGTTAATTGKTIGSGKIVFQALTGGAGTTTDGQLDLRDNGTGNNQVFNYGNNVDMTATGGTIIVGNAVSNVATVSTGGKFVLGTLSLGAGNTITTSSVNGYLLEFGGVTTLPTGGNAIFNTTNGVLTLSGGIAGSGSTFTKTGAGTLRLLGTAGYDSYTLAAGTIELPTVPTGTGRTIDLPLGTGFGAGYAATQANLLDRITLTSAGVAALGVDSTFDPNFTGFTGGLRLGASSNATLTGVITPADGTVRLGGGGATLTLASVNAISGAANLDVNTSGTAAGTVVLAAANNFSGTVAVGGGMILRAAAPASLGSGTSAITLNSGTLQTGSAGDYSARPITLGAGGGTLDNFGNAVTYTNVISGTGTLTVTGAGSVALTNTASTYTGKTILTGGTLSIAADGSLGAAPAAVVADQLQILNNAALAVPTGTVTLPVNRGVTLGTGGATFNVGASSGLTITGIITGANQITKEGAGTLSVLANSTPGPVTINAGTFEIGAAGKINANITANTGTTLRTLGGTDPIGDAVTVTINSGAIFDARGSDTIGRLVGGGLVTKGTAGAVTLTLSSTTDALFSGVVENGTGTVALNKLGANTFTLTGANTYTGATTIGTGVLAIQGPTGALANTAITVGDNNGGDESLSFGAATDVWSGGALNRLGDTGTIALNGRVKVTYTGPDSTSTGFNEVMGTLTTGTGANVFTLVPGNNAAVQVSPSSLVRASNGTLLVRGANLGGTGVGSTRLSPTTVALVGSGGADGSTSVSIVPYIVGDSTGTGAGSSFVTNSPNGLRLLTNSEYASTIAGVDGRNVSVTGGETVSANAAINSLRLGGGTTTLNAKVADTSGAVLFTGSGTIDGTGSLDFGTTDGVINVAQNTTSATATINASLGGVAGVSVGSFGFDASGNYLTHTVILGGNNTFAGNLTINQGILRFGSNNAINPMNPVGVIFRPNSSLQLGGNSVTIRDIGTGNSGGSFALQNAAATSGTLNVFSVAGSTWASGITDGTGGGALNLRKIGAQNLTLTAVNTYSGATTVERGGLIVNAAGRLTNTGADGTAAINLNGGSTFRLSNSSGTSLSVDRLRNDATITMRGATFDFDNSATAATNYAETTGALVLAGGFNLVTADQAASGNTSTLTFASLTRNAGSQAQVNFTSQVNGTTTAGLIGANTRDRVVFTTAPTLNDGMIGGWAFVDGVDFATYNALPSVGILATTADAESAWDTTKNVKITTAGAAITLTDNRTVNSLNLPSGQSLNLGGFALNVDTGGFIHQTTVATDTISNGTITAGNTAGSDLVLRVTGGTLTNSAVITDNGVGSVGLTKTGAGKLVLTAANTYTGPTYVGGTLSIAADSALGVAPASATPGYLKIYDGTLEVTADTTLNANRGIELGGSASTISVTTGTLTYNGIIDSPSHTDLTVNGNANFGGNVNIGGSANFNTTQNVTVAGNANVIGGGLNVAAHTVTGQPVYTTNVTYAGTGSLTLGMNFPGVTDLNIGYRTQAPTPDTAGQNDTGKLDLSSLSTFTASVANLRLGVSTAGSNAGVKGELLLAASSNIVASAGVAIGDSTANGNTGVTSLLQFGGGSSSLTTPSIIVGGRKGSGQMKVLSGGTVRLGGFGTGTTDLLVAYNNQDATGVTALGTVDFSAGTLVADLDELVIGFKNGTGANSGAATGTMTLGNLPHQIVANQIRLGDSQSGSTGTTSGALNVGGGSVTVNTDISVGLRTGSAGTGTGNLNITGGTVTVGGNITTTNSASANATVTLNGGTLDMTNGNINVDTFNAQTGTLKNVAQIFAGDGATPAALSKSGAGTLAVEGANTYTGGTIVTGGTLLVNGSISGAVTTSGAVTVGGSGSIGGLVDIVPGATLSPGAGIGKLDIGGALLLGDTSTVRFELNGLTAGTGYDQVNAASVSLGSNVNLSLTLGFAPNVASNPLFFILNRSDATTYASTFAGLAEGAKIDLGNGFVGTLTYNANWTGNTVTSSFTGGNDIAIAVPEPGSVATLLGGIGSLLGLGRFRRRHARA